MNDIAELEDRMRVALLVDADSAPVRHLSPEEFRASLSDDDGLPVGPAVVRRRPLFQRGLVAAALIAGVTTGVVALSMSGSSNAFASWISRPGTISESDTAALDVECRESDPSLGRPVVVDRRGHSAYAVYAGGSETTDCLMTVPGETPDRGLPSGRVSHQRVSPATPSPQLPLLVLSATATGGNSVPGSPVTSVSGRVDSTVATVTVDTSSDRTVEATVRDGWFAAWWPGNDSDTAVVRAYSTKGALLETADDLNCVASAGLDPRIQLPARALTGGCR